MLVAMGPRVVVIVEPPDGDDPHWVVEAPAIHYQAQGSTRRQAMAQFEAGLVGALEWARQCAVPTTGPVSRG